MSNFGNALRITKAYFRMRYGHIKIHKKKSFHQNQFIFLIVFYNVIINTRLQDEHISKTFITQKVCRTLVTYYAYAKDIFGEF